MKGKRILYVTNNSTKSRAPYIDKFESLGLDAQKDDIFGSSYAAAYYLKHIVHFPTDKKVYIVGQGGIKDELTAEGISFCGSDVSWHLF